MGDMETEEGVLAETGDIAAEPDAPGAAAGARSLRLAAARSQRRSRLLGAALAVAVVLLVIASTLVVSQRGRANRLAQREAERRAVASAAGSFGEALLSYDFNDLEAARRRVVRLATENFGRNYSDAFAAGLKEAITQLQASAKATVKDVYVAGVSGDEAHAIVVLDSEVRSTAGVRQVVGSYLDLTLQRRRGSWKVDSATSIAATRESNTPPGPATTPPSTAPANPSGP
jgi:Mce-associated membrane protein